MGKTVQAFRLGGGPAVQTSLNSFGWPLRQSDSAIKRPRQTMIRILFVFDRAIPHTEEFERGLFEGTGLGGNPVSSFTKWNRDA